jgi:hypothetical protein
VEISAWLKGLEGTGLASGIRDSLYLFPFLEAVHVMALSVVFGTIMIVACQPSCCILPGARLPWRR